VILSAAESSVEIVGFLRKDTSQDSSRECESAVTQANERQFNPCFCKVFRLAVEILEDSSQPVGSPFDICDCLA